MWAVIQLDLERARHTVIYELTALDIALLQQYLAMAFFHV
jgi:hypothetical protein